MTDPRMRLVEERARLRAAQDDLKLTKARSEATIIALAGGPEKLGSNQADRERRLAIELAEDAEYPAALRLLRAQEHLVETLDVEVELLRDEVRRERNRLLDRLAVALGSGAVADGDLSRLADRLVEPVGERLAERLSLLAPGV
jgi:hypothetical protein